MRRLGFLSILMFVSIGGVWGMFEKYVVDTWVGPEEYANFEVIEEFSSRAMGGSIVSGLEESGIYLQNRGLFDVQSDLTIRGSRFNQTSVALNGVVLNDIQSGHLNLSLPVTIFDIDVVTVQKSGNSVMYGSDAIGGVVNFVIFGMPEENVKFKVYSGDYGLFGGVVSVAKGFGPVGLKLSFDRKSSSGYKFNTDFNSWVVNATVVSKIYGIDALAFVGHLEKSFGASMFYRTEARERETVTIYMLNLSKGDFRVNLFHKRSTDNYIVNILNPLSQVNNHIKVSSGLDIQNTFRFGSWGDLFLKFEGRWNAIDSTAEISGTKSNLLGNRYDAPFAIVGEYGIFPTDTLSLSLGSRADFWYLGDRVHGTIISPSFKGYYYALPSLKLSVNANRFFRVPTYVELYYYDGVAFGNTNLLPEEGWNYELNLKYFLNPEKRSFIYLSGFWRDSINVIDFADDKTTPEVRFVATNIRWISGGGVEIGLNLDTTQVLGEKGNVKLFYAYSKFNSGVPENFTFRYDRYLEHQANLAILQNFRGLEAYLLVSFRNRFEGKDAAGNLLPYTTYTLVNAKVSYEVVGGGRIFLEGYNLGDAKYNDIRGVEMPGRWVWAGVEFKMF